MTPHETAERISQELFRLPFGSNELDAQNFLKKEIEQALIQAHEEGRNGILNELINSEEILYLVSKYIAETDSIGEGYGYCNNYSKSHFKNDEEYKPVAKSILEEIAQKIMELK